MVAQMMKPDAIEEVTDMASARARLASYRQQIRQESGELARRLQTAPVLSQPPGKTASMSNKRGQNK